MKACGITHVINMCGVSAPNFFPAEMQYYRLPLRDHTTVDISALFFSLIFLIERARIEGGVVLIHCVKGISRSPAVAIAYLMWSKKW
jgi:dual specificity MAP kinase phosphatase